MWTFDRMGRGRVSTPSPTLSKGQLHIIIYIIYFIYIYIWFGTIHGFRHVLASIPHRQGDNCILCTSVSFLWLPCHQQILGHQCLSKFSAGQPWTILTLLLVHSHYYFHQGLSSILLYVSITLPWEFFFNKSWKSKFLYEVSQILYVETLLKKIKILFGPTETRLWMVRHLWAASLSSLSTALPRGPGHFVLPCHRKRNNTNLSLLTRAREPDFTSRPICGNCQVLF